MEQTQEEIDELREQFNQKNRELNNAIEEYEQEAGERLDLNVSADSTDAVFVARDKSQNDVVVKATEQEYVDRQSRGGGIEHRGDDDFLDMFASAQELEMTDSFNTVASGEIQIPEQNLSQDVEVSGARMSLNPMA
jgi:hypothetical protein